jgi:hypothetical protein
VKTATYLPRANLRHVQNDNRGHETDADTGDETTGDKKTKSVRSSLEDATDGIDDTSGNDSWTTTNIVSEITSHKGTCQIERKKSSTSTPQLNCPYMAK